MRSLAFVVPVLALTLACSGESSPDLAARSQYEPAAGSPSDEPTSGTGGSAPPVAGTGGSPGSTAGLSGASGSGSSTSGSGGQPPNTGGSHSMAGKSGSAGASGSSGAAGTSVGPAGAAGSSGGVPGVAGRGGTSSGSSGSSGSGGEAPTAGASGSAGSGGSTSDPSCLVYRVAPYNDQCLLRAVEGCNDVADLMVPAGMCAWTTEQSEHDECTSNARPESCRLTCGTETAEVTVRISFRNYLKGWVYLSYGHADNRGDLYPMCWSVEDQSYTQACSTCDEHPQKHEAYGCSVSEDAACLTSWKLRFRCGDRIEGISPDDTGANASC